MLHLSILTILSCMLSGLELISYSLVRNVKRNDYSCVHYNFRIKKIPVYDPTTITQDFSMLKQLAVNEGRSDNSFHWLWFFFSLLLFLLFTMATSNVILKSYLASSQKLRGKSSLCDVDIWDTFRFSEFSVMNLRLWNFFPFFFPEFFGWTLKLLKWIQMLYRDDYWESRWK